MRNSACADARGAAPCAGARADRRGCACAPDRGLQLPAHTRAPSAVPQRRADARDAGRAGRARGAGRVAGLCRLCGADDGAGRPLHRPSKRSSTRFCRQGERRALRGRRRHGRRVDLERRAGRRRRGRRAGRASRRPRLYGPGHRARPAAAIWQSSRYMGLPEKSRQRFDSVAAGARRRAEHRRGAPRRHDRAPVRPARDGQPARCLSRAADRISGRASTACCRCSGRRAGAAAT